MRARLLDTADDDDDDAMPAAAGCSALPLMLLLLLLLLQRFLLRSCIRDVALGRNCSRNRFLHQPCTTLLHCLNEFPSRLLYSRTINKRATANPKQVKFELTSPLHTGRDAARGAEESYGEIYTRVAVRCAEEAKGRRQEVSARA
ncbi:unnamed protein product [Closterium sp. NIES-54]